MLNLAVFASGRGSNFKAILQAIQEKKLDAEITLLVSNNPDAGCLDTALENGISSRIISRKDFSSREEFVKTIRSSLQKAGTDLIVLAGYMKKIPDEILEIYTNRIINIHPALLPSFGGSGMYGIKVHEAVLNAGCKVTGVTVHFVVKEYDRGPIIAQQCVEVRPDDTPEILAARVLKTEHSIYWRTIRKFAEGKVFVSGSNVIVGE